MTIEGEQQLAVEEKIRVLGLDYDHVSNTIHVRSEKDLSSFLSTTFPRPSIHPRGLDTHPALPPQGPKISLAKHMNHVLAIHPDDGDITCEAGCTIEQINHALSPYSLYLPMDTGVRAATVGGALSVDVRGPASLPHGPAHRLLLQYTGILADGRLVQQGSRSQGPVHVDPQIHAMHPPVVVITRCTLRVVPIPPFRQTVVASFPSLKDAICAGQAVKDIGGLTKCDFMNVRTCDFLPVRPIDGHLLMLEIAGGRELSEEKVAFVKGVLLEWRVTHQLWLGGAQGEDFWAEARGWSVLDHTPVALEIGLPQSSIVAAIEFILAKSVDIGSQPFVFGSVFGSFVVAMGQMLPEIIDIVNKVEGEWCPIKGVQRKKSLIEDAIKKALDPQAVFI